MKISFFGSGNVASHLAKHISRLDDIHQVYSRTFEHSELFASAIECEAVKQISELDEVDILIIAAHDDEIRNISQQIQLKETLIVHTSGTVSIDALANHKHYGLLYPLQTFTSDRSVDFHTLPVFLEGNNPKTLEQLFSFAESHFKNVHELSYEQRQYLHVGAVILNNFMNHLMAKTKSMLQDVDLDLKHLMPLMMETISKAKTADPTEHQTGPAKRGDHQTIEKHLDLIDDPDLEHIYEVITKSILKTYH